MAIHRLTNRFVNTVTKAGMHNDGLGLYLQVGEGGSAKSWIFRYRNSRFGKSGSTHMGLGPTHTISLDEARELARTARQQLQNNINPIESRKAERLAKQLEESRRVTFAECATDYVDFMSKKRDGWALTTTKNSRNRIKKYLNPALGGLPIAAIDHEHCFQVLKPIVHRVPSMAIHVHMELKCIFDRAKARGRCTGDNPASLDGPLGVLLPELKGGHDVEHLPSLSYEKISPFMAQLRTPREAGTTAYTLPEAAEATGRDKSTILVAIHHGKLKAYKRPGMESSQTARWFIEPDELQKLYPLRSVPNRQPVIELEAYLLQFQILTAARPGEARLMRWDEAPNWEETGLWIIPWWRHKIGKKTKKPVFKPLSPPAFVILEEMKAAQKAEGIVSDFVFAQSKNRLNARIGKPMNDGKVRDYLARFFDPNEATVHGFRTTFSSWATDQRGFDPRDIERALGHIVGDGETATARIYNRYAKRREPLREMMEAWAEHCARTEPLPADVVPFRQAK
jgi:integrase